MVPLTVDVFSDIVCPWCFIGTARLDKVLAELGQAATVRLHPYLLRPDTPPEGINIPEMLRQRYGADPRQMFATVEAAARDAGITLDLGRQQLMYPTIAAHTLLRHAEAKGTQAALGRALFAAYFLEGRNIAQPDVLAAVAAPHGFTVEEVARLVSDPSELEATKKEAEQASARGIRGVPLFLFNGLALSGAQPEAAFRAAIQQATQA